jgi:hypothetical protein
MIKLSAHEFIQKIETAEAWAIMEGIGDEPLTLLAKDNATTPAEIYHAPDPLYLTAQEHKNFLEELKRVTTTEGIAERRKF